MPNSLRSVVRQVCLETPIVDPHTHLYAPCYGSHLLWGIDELLTYHYLIAEYIRVADETTESFWRRDKIAQAEVIWKTLFVDRSPLSEACRGVLTTLHALGLDTGPRELPRLRQWFREQDPAEHIARCFDLAGVETVYMTNSPWDPVERQIATSGMPLPAAFRPTLRLDNLLLHWSRTASTLREEGFPVRDQPDDASCAQVMRFLEQATERIGAVYLMTSWPCHQRFPDDSHFSRVLEGAVLPFCARHGYPLALMVGAKPGLNPHLRSAGTGVGLADLDGVERAIAGWPEVRFLLTVLARENQHQACVMARKFRHLHLFGCWWFMNNPVLVEETTRMRLEMLGTSFTMQHSDARVVEQLIYKWRHTREILAKVLEAAYAALPGDAWPPSEAEIRREARALLGGEFLRFLKPPVSGLIEADAAAASARPPRVASPLSSRNGSG